MVNGAHVLLFSPNAEADRHFVRDVLKFPHVDVGHGWLIFKLPPSEVAVHPAEPVHSSPPDGMLSASLYLMCEDVDKTIAELHAKHVTCSPIKTERWGKVTAITLPSGATLGLYQP